MIEISLTDFIKLTGLSKNTVYARVENGKIKSRKDENGRVFIQLDIELPVTKQNDKETQLEDVSRLVGGFITEYKEVVNKLEEQYKIIIELKDKEIEELKKRGFFKRLLG